VSKRGWKDDKRVRLLEQKAEDERTTCTVTGTGARRGKGSVRTVVGGGGGGGLSSPLTETM